MGSALMYAQISLSHTSGFQSVTHNLCIADSLKAAGNFTWAYRLQGSQQDQSLAVSPMDCFNKCKAYNSEAPLAANCASLDAYLSMNVWETVLSAARSPIYKMLSFPRRWRWRESL